VTAPAVSSPAASRRPRKPPRSWLFPIGLVGALVLTIWAWVTVGIDLGEMLGSIGAGAGILSEVFDGPGSAADENVFRDIYGRSLTADDILQPAAPVDVHESLAGLSSDPE
jgi:hypothetical protein